MPEALHAGTSAAVDTARLQDFCSRRWDDELLPLLQAYIRVPAKSPAFDADWIDPVCKMLAPYAAYRRTAPTEPWFCSELCAEAYRRSPEIYRRAAKASGAA